MSEINLTQNSHEDWMKKALRLATKAMLEDEVPVGAIVVYKGKIIGQGYNQCNTLNDATAHAEMLAITAASNTLGDWRLNDCTMYVTKEPCPMCAGAAYWTRLKKVVIAAHDDKRGYRSINENMLHPKTKVKWGVMEVECSTILKEFFAKKRNGF